MEDPRGGLNYLPTIGAQIALERNDDAKAVETLEAAARYELGLAGGTTFSTSLYPDYVRGEVYLAANQGASAAVEFQKILDHPGIVVNEPIGALAHLGLGRAYAMAGDSNKARTAFQDFLALWKNADPDVPILIQAKSECASCNSRLNLSNASSPADQLLGDHPANSNPPCSSLLGPVKSCERRINTTS